MSNKIAYTQIDGWGVVGQIFDIVQIRPATFGSLDYSGTQSAMVVQITTKSGADLLSQAQLEDPDYFLRQIGSNFWIDANNGVDQIQGRYTLRAIRTISDIVVDLIFFYPDGVAPIFSLDLNNPYGTLTLEDFYRLSTDIPELDFYTETKESSYVDVGGGVRLPLPPMGSDTRSRWLPILSDFTSTIGQKVKLDGGIESSDGISISFIRDRKYEQTYKNLFQSFVTSTSEPRDERPFIYRDQKSPNGLEWVFTNEITPNRFKTPYDITEYVGTKNNTVPWDLVTKDFFWSLGFSSSSSEIWRNPIAYYDNVIHTNSPLFSEAEPRDNVNDYILRTRLIWTNSEAMQVKNIVVGGLLPTTRVSIRRGILNTEIKTHATQSEMYNSMPYPEGQRLRLFVDDLKLSYVKDREGFEYTGLIIEGKSDNNTASFSFNISTDVFSIYSSLNSGTKTQQAGTTSGSIRVSTFRSSPDDRKTFILKDTQETNLPSLTSFSEDRGYVCTTSLYSSDEVYIRLAQRDVSNQDIDYDWISNDDNNNMVYERNKYFWGWVVWDDHYYRVVKDYKNFPVYKSRNSENEAPQTNIYNFPLFSLGNLRGDDFTVISHTPYFFNCIDPRKYEKTETSGAWFINKGLLTELQKVDSVNFGLTNLVVKKEYPTDTEELKWVFPVQDTFQPNTSERIAYNFNTDLVLFQDPFAEIPTLNDPDENYSASPIDVSVIPKYREKETTLGHVFETSSYNFLRREIESYYEGIEGDIGTTDFYDQYCIVNIIDVILQLLTSTDTGTNSFKNLSSYSIANTAFENKFNFDILPAGLGLGIPTELIDLDSFLGYIFDSAKRTERVLLVKNLAITIDDAKDKTKLIESLLQSIYCTIITDERGILKLVDALSKTAPTVIDVDDLANPDDQGTYSHSKITENITESILLQIDTYISFASFVLLEFTSDFTSYFPYPKTSMGQKINISSSTNLQDQNGESLFVNGGFLQNLSSDIFSKIQSKPKETQVDLMKAGGGRVISRSSLLPSNEDFANIARTYIERYSRPVSTYEVNLKRSKQVGLGGIYNIVLPNLPNLQGIEGGEVVGILIEQSVDIFNDIRSCVFYILQQNISRGEKDRVWTAAGEIETVDNPTTFRIFDNKYQTGFFDSLLPRDETQDKDIKGFLAGDFVSIYNKYFELKGIREVTQVDFNTNEIKIASATTPNIVAGDIVMISNITDQTSLFEEDAGRLFVYNNQQHKWK